MVDGVYLWYFYSFIGREVVLLVVVVVVYGVWLMLICDG